MRRVKRVVQACILGPLLLAAVGACAGCQCQNTEDRKDSRDAGGAKLRFLVDGKVLHEWATEALRRDPRSRRIAIQDRHYKRLKHYRAIPLWGLLVQAYGPRLTADNKGVLILNSLDGYELSVSTSALKSPDVYVAFEDLDHTANTGNHADYHAGNQTWEPLGARRTNPGPYYIVWRHTQPRDTSRDPWVWALVSIDLAELSTRYAATYPPTHPPHNSANSSAAHVADGTDKSIQQGHALFLRRCIKCHSINRQGGTLGPELNVPRNILEYRDREQLRAFIRDPQSFRFSAMPRHLDLRTAELDNLLNYLGAMASKKQWAGAPSSTATKPP